jgi:hypothetical protein
VGPKKLHTKFGDCGVFAHNDPHEEQFGALCQLTHGGDYGSCTDTRNIEKKSNKSWAWSANSV